MKMPGAKKIFKIEYDERVFKEDLSVLSPAVRQQIKIAIESKLLTDPSYFGKPLRGSLKHYYSLRVGNYRVIYRVEQNIIKIFLIKHHSIVYKIAFKRQAS